MSDDYRKLKRLLSAVAVYPCDSNESSSVLAASFKFILALVVSTVMLMSASTSVSTATSETSIERKSPIASLR
eukprot:UN03742